MSAIKRASDYDRQNTAAAEWIVSLSDLYHPESGPAVWARLVLERGGTPNAADSAAVRPESTGAQQQAFSFGGDDAR